MSERQAELLRLADNARRAGLDYLADHLARTAELHAPLGVALTDAARERQRRRRAVAGPAMGGVA